MLKIFSYISYLKLIDIQKHTFVKMEFAAHTRTHADILFYYYIGYVFTYTYYSYSINLLIFNIYKYTINKHILITFYKRFIKTVSWMRKRGFLPSTLSLK